MTGLLHTDIVDETLVAVGEESRQDVRSASFQAGCSRGRAGQRTITTMEVDIGMDRLQEIDESIGWQGSDRDQDRKASSGQQTIRKRKPWESIFGHVRPEEKQKFEKLAEIDWNLCPSLSLLPSPFTSL